MSKLIYVERNQASRAAHLLFDDIYYYFMPAGMMYLNIIKDDNNYSALSLTNLKKKLNTPEKREEAVRMFAEWMDNIEDLDWRSRNFEKKRNVWQREYQKLFDEPYTG